MKFKATDKANVEMGVYWDFKYAEEKAKDKLGVNYEVYILKVIYQGFDAYIIIEIKNSPNYSIKTLKIPYYDKFGEVKSYRYFQEFK